MPMIEPSWENCRDCIHNIIVLKSFERKTNYCKKGGESIYGYWMKIKVNECPEKEAESSGKE